MTVNYCNLSFVRDRLATAIWQWAAIICFTSQSPSLLLRGIPCSGLQQCVLILSYEFVSWYQESCIYVMWFTLMMLHLFFACTPLFSAVPRNATIWVAGVLRSIMVGYYLRNTSRGRSKQFPRYFVSGIWETKINSTIWISVLINSKINKLNLLSIS